MKWNNGKARKALKQEQERLLKLGMTEEQAQSMYDMDLAMLNGYRREARHTQRLDLQAFDEDDELDDGKNPLLDKFEDRLTVELDLSGVSRYSWIEEMENEGLAVALKSMPQDYIELLTEIVIDGYTHSEIAEKHNVCRTAITNKIARVKKIIEKFSSGA